MAPLFAITAVNTSLIFRLPFNARVIRLLMDIERVSMIIVDVPFAEGKESAENEKNSHLLTLGKK